MGLARNGYNLGRLAVSARVWKVSHAQALYDQAAHRRRNEHAAYADADHLWAAASWLERAQDAMTDGGVCGRYGLDSGWTSSYPETTGYIIPTFLALAGESGGERFVARARRAVEFLLACQAPDGWFPGGEIHEGMGQPAVFNTAQILHGLTSWHARTGDENVLAAARRAGDWLLSVQDDDGAWRRFVYLGVPAAYSAHASCWLAEFGEHVADARYLEAARRHLDWVLAKQDPDTGWFDLCGFSAEDHAHRVGLTHTIAYTLAGALRSSEILHHAAGIKAVARAAAAVAHRLQLSKRLPGVLDHNWKARSHFICLTGNAQMALVWDRLFWLTGDGGFLNAALLALDGVKAAQLMRNRAPGLRGGVPGSAPMWGRYLSLACPNWPAKFFVDALLAKRETMRRLGERPARRVAGADTGWRLPPAARVDAARQRPTVVMITTAGSGRVPTMLAAWDSWGFKPDAVVIQDEVPAPPFNRLLAKIRDDGAGAALQRLLRRRPAASAAGESAAAPDLSRTCVERGLRAVRTGPLNSPQAVAALEELRPDILVQAGAGGILRSPLLGVPRLGTLNAHMGLLPGYRGMNVSEWSLFHHDAVGCSVHLVDAGVDTGDILGVRVVPTGGLRTVGDLRSRVDAAQIELLGEVLRWIIQTGSLPPFKRQQRHEGSQYFRMHPEIVRELEREMSAR